jgi:hypothetical protein
MDSIYRGLFEEGAKSVGRSVSGFEYIDAGIQAERTCAGTVVTGFQF